MRKSAEATFLELKTSPKSVAELFRANAAIYKEARRIVIAKDQTPILKALSGKKLVIVPGSHLMPSETVPKTSAVINATDPLAVIFSGGRTIESIPEGQSEASLLRDAFSAAHRGISVPVLIEDKSEHTRENFEMIAEQFRDKLEQADHFILVTHPEHSNRAKMTARQAFCYTAGLMTEAEFDWKTVMALYLSDRPEHNIHNLDQIALVVAKMIDRRVYDDTGIRHIKPTDAENIVLDRIYTQAQKYALTA